MIINNLYKSIVQQPDIFALNSSFGSSWRKLGDKWQIILGKTSNVIDVLYYSKKYEKYMHVALSLFVKKNRFGESYVSSLIYGNTIITSPNLAYNPDWLDVYHDTVYQHTNLEPYITGDEYHVSFWNKFGNDLLPLIELDNTIECDNVKQESSQLYYQDLLTSSRNQYSIDLPDVNNNYMDDVEFNDGLLEYRYNLFFKKALWSDGRVFNVYNSLHSIYNHIHEQSDDQDIISINNQYSFIVDVLRSEYENAPSTYQQYDTLYEGVYDIKNGDNTPIVLKFDRQVKVEDVVGVELYNLFNKYKTTTYEYSGNYLLDHPKDSMLSDVHITYHYGEYVWLTKFYKAAKLESLSIASRLKKYDNLNDVVINLNYNDLNYALIKINGYMIAIRKSTDIVNTSNSVTIPVNILSDTFLHEKSINDPTRIEVQSAGGKYTIYHESNTFNMPLENYFVSLDLLTRTHTDISGDTIVKGDTVQYDSFISYADSTIHNNIESFQFDLDVTNFKFNDFIFSNNIINNDDNRYRISGVTFNTDESDNAALAKVMNILHPAGGISDAPRIIKNYINDGQLKVEEYPLPLMVTDFASYININTANTISSILNDTIYSENVIYNNFSNGFNLIEVRDVLNAYVDSTTSPLSVYDRSLYNIYNKEYCNVDLSQIRNQKNIFFMFSLIDTLTGVIDFILIDALGDITKLQGKDLELKGVKEKVFSHRSKKFKYSFAESSTYKYFTNYEDDPYTEETKFTTKVIHENDYTEFPVYLKRLVLLNGSNLNGQINGFRLVDAKCFDGTNYVTLDATIDMEDLVLEGTEYCVDLTSILPENYIMVENFTLEVLYSKLYKNYDYRDVFSVRFEFNLRNLNIAETYRVKATFSARYEDAVNNTLMDVCFGRPFSRLNIIPQRLYNFSLGANIFDINDYILDYVADNKLCVVLNNYVGNIVNANELSLNDLTDGTNVLNTTDIEVLDRNAALYERYLNEYKIYPLIKSKNFYNKYLRVFVKAELPQDSTSLFEEFSYINSYNIGATTSDGVIFMEGKISDYDGINADITDMLKLYRTESIFTVWHNVINEMITPINFKLTFKLYDTKEDFLNNIDSTVIDTRYSKIDITLLNRGDSIAVESDHYPRIVETIEYYDINPEYELQTEKEHTKTVSVKLKSKLEEVKVSELYFDVLFKSDDILFGVPVDFTNYEGDTIFDVVEFNYIEDKEEILNYINWLTRNVCQNCTDAHLWFKIKIKPSSYGFNVANFTFASYSHNVKIEEMMYYVYYKESADTLMVLDKKATNDTELLILPNNIRQDLYTLLNGDSFGSNMETEVQDFCGKVQVPRNAKVTLLMFNSSLLPKKLRVKLATNTSDKEIINTEYEMLFPAFDFRIITFSEPVLMEQYNGGFSGGLATYTVEEISEVNDTTTVLDNEALQIPIPSFDETMSRFLSFMDRVVKLVEIKYKKNDSIDVLDEGTIKVDQNYKSRGIARVNPIRRGLYKWATYGGLTDIDARFYVDDIYEVTIDVEHLKEYSAFTELTASNTINIKVPVSIPDYTFTTKLDSTTLKPAELNEMLIDSTGLIEETNNYYEDTSSYLILSGNRTNINTFTFKLQGMFYYNNTDVLNMLVNNLYDSGINSFGLIIQKRMINPVAILSMLFGNYGNEAIEFVIDTFINGNITFEEYEDNVKNLISTYAHIFDKTNGNIGSEFGLNFTTDSNAGINDALRNVQDETISSVLAGLNVRLHTATDGMIDVPARLSDKCVDGEIKDQFMESMKFLRNFFINKISDASSELYNKQNISYNIELPTDSEGLMRWTFDDVYQVLNDSIVSIAYDPTTAIETFFTVSRSPVIGQPKLHDIKVSVDGTFDKVNSVYVGATALTNAEGRSFYTPYERAIVEEEVLKDGAYSNDVGYINPKGDKTKLLAENVKINVMLKDFSFNYINFTFDDINYSLKNLIYPSWLALKAQLLKNPLRIDLKKNAKFTVIQDTNYKLLFDLPIEIFKSVESYLTIDKIRIADNFINNNDYHVTFGDTNERYILSGSGDLDIGKVIDKFTGGIRMYVQCFNIANHTGAYCTSLLIYYTFNGEQYVERSDFKYDIVLPKSLDNEYLIVDVNRMDYNPPVMKSVYTDVNGKKIEMETNSMLTKFVDYYDVLLGTPGCNLSYPDFMWHDSYSPSDLTAEAVEGTLPTERELQELSTYSDLL